LKLEIPVRRDEDLESALFGTLEQQAVLETRPALLLHGTNLMSGQVASEVTGQLFIE
jgi:hypothetical protein